MTIAALILLPLVAGVAAMFWPSQSGRRALLIVIALAHLGLTASIWVTAPGAILDGWLALDDLGTLFLSIVSALFLTSAVYAMGYLQRESEEPHRDIEESFLFTNAPEAIFIGCLLLFLSAMTLVCAAQHLGVLWVGIEATTLASAPLIYYHRHHHSLEATWKYLMICSVGIALALLGNFILSVSASGRNIELLAAEMVKHAGELDRNWLFGAFLFFIVGYGTKMGLAPMHTWLPDAHSQAPSLVSALLSGALLNCALLGILRVHEICVAAGVGERSGDLLVFFGLLSMGLASVFIIQQPDFKRMLAYSSVEHMGILALGVGLGGAGAFGALLHSVNHSLTKASLFLTAGTIMMAYRTREIDRVTGVLRVAPMAGALWIAGFLSITGSPPFGTFLSEFTILKAALDEGRFVVAALYLLFLSLIFIGMANIVLRMAQGSPPEEQRGLRHSESFWMTLPPAVLAALVLLFGLFVPAPLSDLAKRASAHYEAPVRVEQALASSTRGPPQ